MLRSQSQFSGGSEPAESFRKAKKKSLAFLYLNKLVYKDKYEFFNDFYWQFKWNENFLCQSRLFWLELEPKLTPGPILSKEPHKKVLAPRHWFEHCDQQERLLELFVLKFSFIYKPACLDHCATNTHSWTPPPPSFSPTSYLLLFSLLNHFNI